jgi:hypothetical protein
MAVLVTAIALARGGPLTEVYRPCTEAAVNAIGAPAHDPKRRWPANFCCIAKFLFDHRFAVRGLDASSAMIELARNYEPGAKFDVLPLPTGLHDGYPMIYD